MGGINPVRRASLTELMPSAEQLLLHPHSVAAKKGLNYGRTFELRVAWLLALFGFSAIIPHEYEELSPAAGPQLSSADILSSHPEINAVFAIGCTTSSPDEKDFSKLLDVRGVPRYDLFVRLARDSNVSTLCPHQSMAPKA